MGPTVSPFDLAYTLCWICALNGAKPVPKPHNINGTSYVFGIVTDALCIFPYILSLFCGVNDCKYFVQIPSL